jgi:hypothetical protein
MAEFTEKYINLRNLNKLDSVPDKLREHIFEKLFETWEISKFAPL